MCELFDGVEPECHLGIPVEWVRTPEDLQECIGGWRRPRP